MNMNPENKTNELIQKLFDKYRLSGQDTNDYLEGLLVSNYEPYWKYLHIDTLLSLQNPKTDFHDELIFIGYHQITELYFRLILHEINHVKEKPTDEVVFEKALNRINRYFKNLINSFDIMTDGMLPEEFLKFRMALLPASGFQSYQFRLIEISLTQLENLVDKQSEVLSHNLLDLYNGIYWKKGSIDLKTGEKTLTLRQFEQQYDSQLLNAARKMVSLNFNVLYHNLAENTEISEGIKTALKMLDVNINVNWRLAHYRSAVRYLQREDADIAATGGTNWQKFLPPRFQRIVSFPSLWSSAELDNWGKSWVEENVIKSK